MTKAIATLAVLMLAGCVSQIEGTPAGGILKVVGNKTGTALKTAQVECSKYGKDARIGQQNVWNNTISYDCVAR